ncbi:MAG: Thiamine-phosphate synthase [Holosporales bacterium]
MVVVLIQKKMHPYPDLRLCLVINCNQLSGVKKAVEGGVTMVQLRDKASELLTQQKSILYLKAMLEEYDVPFYLNDDPIVAGEYNVNVHIGQDDMPSNMARKILSDLLRIGLSINTWDQLHEANKVDGLYYVSASAVFKSKKTKPDCATLWGLEGLKKFVEISKYPVMSIGGITLDNVESIMRQGCHGVAISGAINDAKDPYEAAQAFRSVIDQSFFDFSKTA